MHQVDLVFISSLGTAVKQKRIQFRQIFTLDKKIIISRMMLIGRLWSQHNFTIGGQSQAAWAVAMVDKGKPTNFNVIILRDSHLHLHRDVMISALKFNFVG